MQTIKHDNENFQLIDILDTPTESYEMITLFCSRQIKSFYQFLDISFVRNNQTNESEIVYKKHYYTKIEVESMQKAITPKPFEKTWERFSDLIEAEVFNNINMGYSYTAESLLHDYMIKTSSHEMSLECVYQSLILLNGWMYADEFRKEMISNIEWVIDMVESSYLEYEREVDIS